jgi:predicted RNase H-like HicB family nuclease
LRQFPSCRRYSSYRKNGKGKADEFVAFFEANENRGYTLTVPALPRLATRGPNLNDARVLAKDAIRCCSGGLRKAKVTIEVKIETAQVKVWVSACEPL